MAAADRRETIIAAALDVFSKRGFHQASLDDVAARAGISKALIYEHFPSKGDLQDALMETYVHELLDRVIAAIGGVEDAEQRLRAGIDAFLGFVEERREAWRMLVRNAAEAGMAMALARVQEEVAQAIAALMAQDAWAAKLGQDPDLERTVDGLAHQLVGAVQFLGNWWYDHPEVSRERVRALAMDFAWVGLERLGQGQRWSA
jgi:AcrR family transcriptional regulator